MKIISPSAVIVAMDEEEVLLKRIEAAGRTCYKSEHKISDESAVNFVTKILESEHHSVIEHASCTVRIICDRGVSHEIVRHRLASYSQESTRYANYSADRFGNEITVVRPYFWSINSDQYAVWHTAMLQAEQAYLNLIQQGATAQQARSVLPNSLKTEVVITCNFREWRHIFQLRCAQSAHPQMREIMLPLLSEMHAKSNIMFADLFKKFEKDIVGYLATNKDC